MPRSAGNQNPSHPSRDDRPDPNTRLIAEYIAVSPSSEPTRHRYATQLGDFRDWLAHPQTARGGSSSLLEVRRADVARFLAYLASGDGHATPRTVPDPSRVLSDSARKNYIPALHSSSGTSSLWIWSTRIQRTALPAPTCA